MKTSTFTEAQIAFTSRQAWEGASFEEVCRKADFAADISSMEEALRGADAVDPFERVWAGLGYPNPSISTRGRNLPRRIWISGLAPRASALISHGLANQRATSSSKA